MKTLSKLTILLLIACRFVAAQNTQQIEKLFVYEKLQESKNLALSWTEKEPQNAEAFYVAGKILSKLGSPDSAETFFKKGIEVNKKYPYNYVGLIRIAYHRKQLDKLEQLVEDAKDFRTSKKDQRWYLEMADACLLAPIENNPIETYTAEAIKLDRKNPQIYMLLGQFYGLQNNATAANEKYQLALDYDNSIVKAYVERGAVYERVKNYAEAEAQYKKAIEMDSTFPPVHGNLAEMYYGLKKYKDAVSSFAKYIKYSEFSVLNQRRYASYLFQAKDYKTAVSILTPLNAKDPKDPYYLRLLAYCYTEQNDSLQALKFFEQYFAIGGGEKKSYNDYSRFGKVLQKVGKDSLAVDNLRIAYSIDTTKYDLLSDIARILKKQNRYKEMEKPLETKIAYGGNSVETMDYIDLATACYYDSSFQKAKETIEKLLTIKPKLFYGYIWLARVLSAMDPNTTQWLAKPAYEKIIELVTQPEKWTKDLVSANSYLGAYYFDQYSTAKEAKDEVKAKEAQEKLVGYWKKVLELDPENAQAKEVAKSKQFKEFFK